MTVFPFSRYIARSLQVESADERADESFLRGKIAYYYRLRRALDSPSAKAIGLDHIRIDGIRIPLTAARAMKLDIEMAGNLTDRRLQRRHSLMILCARLHGRTKEGKPDRNGAVKVYTYGVPWEEVASRAGCTKVEAKRHLRMAIPIMAAELRRKEALDALRETDAPYQEAFIADSGYVRLRTQRRDELSVNDYIEALRRGGTRDPMVVMPW